MSILFNKTDTINEYQENSIYSPHLVDAASGDSTALLEQTGCLPSQQADSTRPCDSGWVVAHEARWNMGFPVLRFPRQGINQPRPLGLDTCTRKYRVAGLWRACLRQYAQRVPQQPALRTDRLQPDRRLCLQLHCPRRMAGPPHNSEVRRGEVGHVSIHQRSRGRIQRGLEDPGRRGHHPLSATPRQQEPYGGESGTLVQRQLPRMSGHVAHERNNSRCGDIFRAENIYHRREDCCRPRHKRLENGTAGCRGIS